MPSYILAGIVAEGVVPNPRSAWSPSILNPTFSRPDWRPAGAAAYLPMSLSIYNTLTRAIESFQPIEEATGIRIF